MPRDITGRVVRHLFELRRIENFIGRDVVDPFLLDLFGDIAGAIARIDPVGVNRAPFRARRLKRLLHDVSALLGGRFPELRQELRGELARLGVVQGIWARGTLGRATDGLNVTIGEPAALGVGFFKTILDEEPIERALFSTWFKGLSDSSIQAVSGQITLGVGENETLDQIIRRVRGDSRGRRGVLSATRRDTETIVRTSINDIANRAHVETYKANKRILKGVEYTATLDTRTSDICISLDGRVWPVDSPDIRRPPQHPNCRSVLVPVVDWAKLGVPAPAEGFRASADGPVSSSTNYTDWLRSQTIAVQNEIIGPARAALFRAGKLDLRQLVTMDNRSRTIEELEKLVA